MPDCIIKIGLTVLAELLSKVTVQFFISTSNIREFQFHVLNNTFKNSHSDRCVMVSHDGFNLHFTRTPNESQIGWCPCLHSCGIFSMSHMYTFPQFKVMGNILRQCKPFLNITPLQYSTTHLHFYICMHNF